MFRKILILALFTISLTNAQVDLPIDFESGSATTADFMDFNGGVGYVENVAIPQNTGNSSTNLAKIVRNADETWAGSYLNLNSTLDFSSESIITLKVWTEAPIGTPVNLKLEEQANPDNNVELPTFTTVSGEWETLSWNFAGFSNNVYNRLVFLFDIGNLGDGTSTSTFFFDDIIQGEAAVSNPCTSGSTGAIPGEDFVLVWADEFDVDGAPCSANWGYDIGGGGWGNGEAQYYTSRLDNAFVNNGLLTIKAKKENFNGNAYTSARLLSKNKYEFTYGKIDIRAKLPTENGTWSALWMLGADFPATSWPAVGEIDIMEHTGNNENSILGTTHNTDGFGGGGNGSHIFMPTPTEFHNYSIIWDEDKIEWFVDDVLFYTYNPSPKTNNNYPYNSDFFLIMNVAMGGTLGQGIDPNFSQASMVVDYVRVYQKTQPLTDPVASAPSPTINESNILSVFSDTYQTNTVSNFNFSDFNGTGNYSTLDIESNGNLTGKMENLSYYGAKWDAEDINAYTYVHFDYWTYDSKAINFFLIDKTAGFGGGEPEEPRYSILDFGGDETIVYSQWQSVFIPLQHFLDYNSGGFSYDLNDIHQYKFDGNGTIYFDNVYFTNATSLSTTNFDAEKFISFPNPTQDFWHVKSESNNIEILEVFDIFGKKVMHFEPQAKLVKLNVSNLPSGMYFANVRTLTGTQNLKFIKK